MSVWQRQIKTEDIYGPFPAGKRAEDYLGVQLVSFDDKGLPEAPVTIPFSRYLASSAETADEFVKARHAAIAGK